MKLKVLGVMTGTSCDGLDASCLEFSESRWKPLWSQSLTYPRALRSQVLALQKKPQTSLVSLLRLHRDLGQWYAHAIKKMLASRRSPLRPDVIANHGQTVAHFPDDLCTAQLGDPTVIAYETGLTVVSEFRRGDMAAGGQGAPLVPLFHRYLLKPGQSIHNLGGISNFSYLSPLQELIGFDTGPGNIWIDAATEKFSRGKQKFDRNGAIGARGKIDHASLQRLLKHPYFQKPPPKSTGRDDFPFRYFQKNSAATEMDAVTTATALTAVTVAQAYERAIIRRKLPLTEIFFCGGGARNSTLLEMIQQLLPQTEIRTIEALGLDAQFIEAHAFALYGYLSLRGANLGGTWTGQKKGDWAPPACITPGRNWPIILNALTDP